MNIHELQVRLQEEGCNPASYAVGSRGGASDAFCLTPDGTQWQVYYTECGQDAAPIFASGSETEACEFFYAHIMSLSHDHCVGFFHSEASAQALQAKLEKLGIPNWQDKIPFAGPADFRYRIFVKGKAKFLAREVLGDVPLRD